MYMTKETYVCECGYDLVQKHAGAADYENDKYYEESYLFCEDCGAFYTTDKNGLLSYEGGAD